MLHATPSSRRIVFSPASVAATASVVPLWSHWLNEQHQVVQKAGEKETEPYPVGRTAEADVDGSPGNEKEWVLYKPTSAKNLAQGFGTTFAYLALLDALIARKAVDQVHGCEQSRGKCSCVCCLG